MRLNVEVTEVQDKLIRELTRLAGVRSKTALINYALTFLAWGLKEAFAGKMIASVDPKSGRYTELQMPPLQYAATCGEVGFDEPAVAKRKPEAHAAQEGAIPKKKELVPTAEDRRTIKKGKFEAAG